MLESLLERDDLLQYAENLIDFILEEYPKKEGLEKFERKDISRMTGLHSSAISRLTSPSEFPKKIFSRPIKDLKHISNVFKVRCSGKVGDRYQFEFYTLKDSPKLIELATKLAMNLVDVSTRFNEYNKPHESIINHNRLSKYRKTNKRERFILIAGAGASHAATKGVMPLTPDAIDIIRERIMDGSKILRKVIKRDIESMDAAHKFETQLLIYSKYAQEEIIEVIKEICRLKYVPNLIYEILGHMVKHRFIDVVFNYNFDEIFDTILGEEISEGAFKYIYSDGHCPNDYQDLLINNRLKQPVFIKPHGTISHINSMRFIKEEYSISPQEIKNTLSNIVNANLPAFKEQRQLRVNFIIIGFSMQSPDLIEIIKKYLDKVSSGIYPNPPYFWFFDKKTRLEDFVYIKRSLSKKQFELIEKNSTFFCVDDEDSLEDYLSALWDQIEKSFNTDYPPRDISRHLLVNSIFSSDDEELEERAYAKKKTRNKNLKQYFNDRILVELVIALLSSDGLLNLNQIMEGRIKHYLHEYSELVGKKLSIRKLCEGLGLKEYKGFVSDVYVLKEPALFYEGALYESLYERLIDVNNLSKKRIATLEKNKDAFLEYAEAIKTKNLLKIKPQFKHPHRNIFSSLKEDDILSTGVSWLYRYRTFYDSQDWDLLLAISEKGRFLPKDEERRDILKGKKVELILSSFDLSDFPNLANRERFERLPIFINRPIISTLVASQ